jgi:hypothetical protein
VIINKSAMKNRLKIAIPAPIMEIQFLNVCGSFIRQIFLMHKKLLVLFQKKTR